VRVVTPPVYVLRDRAVAVRPAHRIVYEHPLVIVRARTPVLVRSGGVAWVRAW
jgi:hypothetical protein